MKHFSVPELCRSSVAVKYRIDNKPNAIEKRHLVELIDNLLEPLREMWVDHCRKNNLGTGAIKVTSGYRNQRVNRLVGGVAMSSHLFGYAADIKPMNGKQSEFEWWISNVFAKSSVLFDQIIIEKSRVARWIHVSIKNRNGEQRMQCFTAVK